MPELTMPRREPLQAANVAGAAARDLSRAATPRQAGWLDRLPSRARRRGAAADLERTRGAAAVRRPDQHPVHVRHDRLAERRDAVAPQHPEQRVLRRRGAATTPTRTGSACRCRSITASAACMGNLAAVTHGAAVVVPAEAFDAGGDAARRSSSTRARPIYGVPTMFIAQLDHPAFDTFRSRVAAHRHHGRRALSDRGDAAGDRAHARAGGDDLLRHDGDLAGLVPVSRRRPDRAARLDGRPRAPARRMQDRRPGDGRGRAARQRRASCARAATPSCSATGTIAEATASAIDAARWMHTGDLAVMRDDGYVNITGRHQGHDHPRRREHLPARDRGVPLHAPEGRRRAGGRRARREVRRRGVRLDPAPGRGRRRRQTRFASSAAGRSRTTRSRATSGSRPSSRRPSPARSRSSGCARSRSRSSD